MPCCMEVEASLAARMQPITHAALRQLYWRRVGLRLPLHAALVLGQVLREEHVRLGLRGAGRVGCVQQLLQSHRQAGRHDSACSAVNALPLHVLTGYQVRCVCKAWPLGASVHGVSMSETRTAAAHAVHGQGRQPHGFQHKTLDRLQAQWAGHTGFMPPLNFHAMRRTGRPTWMPSKICFTVIDGLQPSSCTPSRSFSATMIPQAKEQALSTHTDPTIMWMMRSSRLQLRMPAYGML